MSGSAATIAISQLPNLFGIPNINTRYLFISEIFYVWLRLMEIFFREEAYNVLWKTFKDIGKYIYFNL